jgi:hypothetical protein
MVAVEFPKLPQFSVGWCFPFRFEIALGDRGVPGIAEFARNTDDPRLQLMVRLRKENQFEVVRAVRFAYRDE